MVYGNGKHAGEDKTQSLCKNIPQPIPSAVLNWVCPNIGLLTTRNDLVTLGSQGSTFTTS
jgi:hypothetical protein